jgi:hypothetical protein
MNIILAGLLLGGGVTIGTWLASKIHIAFAVIVCIFFLLPLAGYLFLANTIRETVIEIAENTEEWSTDRNAYDEKLRHRTRKFTR